MRKSRKFLMKSFSPSQEREDKKRQREGELLRENLKKRKLQARTKAQIEEIDLDGCER
tara:strand:- start:954 stop:1127 length:174 start_codon:yes stop_codon:yes gene_type:complete